MSQTSLAEHSTDRQNASFQRDDFKVLIEQNLEYIKTASSSEQGFLQSVEVPDSEAAACEGDFRKVCAYLEIPINLSWVVMRVNDMQHFGEYKKEMTHILIPDFDILYQMGLNKAITQTNI